MLLRTKASTEEAQQALGALLSILSDYICEDQDLLTCAKQIGVIAGYLGDRDGTRTMEIAQEEHSIRHSKDCAENSSTTVGGDKNDI